MNYRISQHASIEMMQRGIKGEYVAAVMLEPDQIVLERDNLVAYQSLVRFECGRQFLLRVIVNPLCDPVLIVTVYRTSKINKYWRRQ